MEFIWNMTEENWKNLMHDMEERDYNKLSSDFDYYGRAIVGDYCIEFIVLNDDDYEVRKNGWTNVYQLYVDDGYGEQDGIPYSLIDAYIDIPKANNFEEFKEICEQEVVENIGSMFKEEYVNKKCEWMSDEIHMNDY